MAADRPDGRQGARALADLFDPSGGAAQIAVTMAALWRDVDDALHPVIGQRGVAALYDRSLHQTARQHPWLLTGHDGMQAQINVAALQASTALQDPAAAAAGAVALCTAFHNLLTSLVGPTLTERMLQDVWQPPTSSMPAPNKTS